MYVYTKTSVQNTHLWAFTAFLFWTRKFAEFWNPKTSADKRRLITIYVQRLLVQGVIVAVCTRPNYPQRKPLRCKVTTFFTDIQNGTLIGTKATAPK